MMLNPAVIRVLFVDDTLTDWNLVRSLLQTVQNIQFVLDCVPSYREAVETMQRGPHDVYLTDYYLGESTGLDVLKAAQQWHPAAPVIVITGDSTLEVETTIMSAGAADFVVKTEMRGNVLRRILQYALDRKRTLQTLLESEARFRRLAEAAFEGIAVSENGIILEVNYNLASMLGYEPHELIGKAAVDFVVGEHGATIIDNIQGGYERSYEVLARRRDGSTFPAEVRGRKVIEAERTLRITAIRDLTERKQTEEALAAERNLLRTVIDSLPDYILMKDDQGRYLLSNIAHAQGGNTTPDAMIGKTAFDFFPADLARQFEADDRQVMQTGLPLLNLERETTDNQGVTRWVLTTKIPLPDSEGRMTRLLGISRDITERRKAEATLKHYQQFIQNIMDVIPDMVYVFDVNLRRNVYINREIARTLGYSPQQIESMGNTVLETLIHPDDMEVVGAHLSRLTELQDGDVQEIEYRMKRADGEWCLLNSRETPFMRDENQSVRQILGFARDVTVVRQVEKQALQFTLEQERTKILSQFVLDASHEFRTPLATIDTSLYLLGKTATSDQQRQRIDTISEQSKRILQLVDDLLTMVRLDAASQLALEPTDLCQLLNQCIAGVQRAAESKGVTVIPPGCTAALTVLAEHDQLSRALAEILDNALRFSPPGGLVEISLVESEGILHLHIRDSGPGISDAALPRIFDRFFREDTAHSTAGFGLGLPIARRIVDLHSGQIMVQSQSGTGTTVIVSLPHLAN